VGFENSCERKLNHDRRAAKKQRARRQSQVQITHHGQMDTPERLGRQMVFLLFLSLPFGASFLQSFALE